jgi:hypothetical protein
MAGGNQAGSVHQIRKNLTKAEKAAREKMEAEIVQSPTKPKPLAFINKAEKKIFNKFVKLNDNFTEADSTSLSILTKSLARYTALNQRLEELDDFDERCIQLEKRIHAYDKQIMVHMQALCIPLNQRLRLNNEMAKLLIEEQKLQQMQEANKPQSINPLLALLGEDDDDE